MFPGCEAGTRLLAGSVWRSDGHSAHKAPGTSSHQALTDCPSEPELAPDNSGGALEAGAPTSVPSTSHDQLVAFSKLFPFSGSQLCLCKMVLDCDLSQNTV